MSTTNNSGPAPAPSWVGAPDGTAWTAGPDGVPLLDDLPSRFAGEIRNRFDYSGDHAAFVVEPVEARHDAAPPWLSFQNVKDVEPGHEP